MMKHGALIILLIAGSQLLHAQGAINTDARGGAMGELGIATTPDANAGQYNLAKLPFTAARSGLALNYAPWLRDITPDMYLLQASGYHRLDTLQALSASVRYFSLGDVAVTDLNGNPVQNAQPREYSLDLGYSRKLAERFSLALAVRYTYTHLVSGTIDGTNYRAGKAVAADVSLFYTTVDGEGKGFSAGLALTNLGNTTGNLGIGLAYTFVMDEVNRVMLGVDGTKVVDSLIKSFPNSGYAFSGGVEYGYDQHFFLRAGYHWEDNSLGGLTYLAAGVGLHYSRFGLNFSYIAPSGNGAGRNPLSNTFRFGLVIN